MKRKILNLISKISTRLLYILESRKTENYRKNLNRTLSNRDKKFAEKDDIPLTDDQKKQVSDFWKPYSFAIKPPFTAVQTSMNRTGIFDPKCVPFSFQKMNKYALNPPRYRHAWQDKAYLPRIFPDARQSRTLVRRIEGMYLNENYEHITLENAASICAEYMAAGNEIVWKSNSSPGGGSSVHFYKDMSKEEMEKKFHSGGVSSITIQEVIKQHEFMASLNNTTVNTVRLTTIRLKNKIVPVAALIKIGSSTSRVDNYVQGGCMIGVNPENGLMNSWALDSNHRQVKTLPSGFEITPDTKVPFFDEIKEMALRCHYSIPNIALIGWDIAVGLDGPILVEENFSSDVRIHQAVYGSVFGEYTKEFMDRYFIQLYYKNRCTRSFEYREYSDHIKITLYTGGKSTVKVPASIKGKPVTSINKSTFSKAKNVIEVILPSSIVRVPKTFIKSNVKEIKKISCE